MVTSRQKVSQKCIQVEEIHSLMHVEFMCPLMSLPTNLKQPRHIDTYIILVDKYLGETVQSKYAYGETFSSRCIHQNITHQTYDFKRLHGI